MLLIVTWEHVKEGKKQNNFVLNLLAYVWGKIRDKLIWTQVVIKDL